MRNWNSEGIYTIFFHVWNLLLTYEELKHVLDETLGGAISLFTTYLWGIETSCVHRCFKLGDLFTTYLWGIETFPELEIIAGSFFIYYLPMRNWNSAVFRLIVFFNSIYYLPMRNWNKGLLKLSTSSPLYLLLTYEELKQVIFVFFKITESIYYLPMRNWNFFSRNSIIEILCHLLLTYEELKLTKFFKGWKCEILFTTYLWGIETFFVSWT